MSAVPVLETRGLGIRFGGLKAVDDVSLSVPEGLTLGVIGPNGAGKSTFINLVTGHLKPTSGTVLVDGRDLTGVKPWVIAKARVARTFQIVKPFRGMTVRENVAVGVLYGPDGTGRMSTALKQADEILAEVGIFELGDRPPGELSVADARRLEFAKALALKPRLLLLDEVMAGLRPGEIEPSLQLIRDLKARGMTIIVVEHVMKAILAVSDEVLVLNAGQRLMLGPPREVLSDPQVIEAYLGHKYATRAAQLSEAASAALAPTRQRQRQRRKRSTSPRRRWLRMLEVKGVCAGYGRVQVLWDVDLTVSANEIVALVGPNGAGKTTLLRALSGMVPIRDGSVTFLGEDITGRSIERIVDLGISHVPEGRRLFPGLTVKDNLRLGGWRNRNTDIDRVIDLFPKLGDRLSQVTGSMSGGEQQMCAIARGLMGKPDLIMIDELSMGLAPVIVEEIIGRLADIAASGTAVLLVEQDVDAALTVAERAYVMETGRVVMSGNAGVLLADPRIQQSYLGIA
ncbi:MAG: ATP-binding cassette domain-containing protein [Actinomycetales bacterium]|uniref:ATP-binding cassette domain-containing protein n=2 Tax=Candidatus Phosphoribacter hodrii TaxID=2953743 RepID=A0A9D7T6L1_9MICO|nr:ATP-binding cassette domain-containing protein [Candidatus Phosphoribacter hodrii]